MFLAAHRAALLGLAGALAALTLFWAARSSRAAMDWWVESVSMPVKRALGAVCDPLPFSVCEAGATLLILGAVGLLVRAIWRAAHGQPAALGAFGLHLAVLLLWGYAGVCALWGTQYYAASFAEKAGMETAPVSAAQLEAVTRYFGRQVAACADAVPRDGVFFCFMARPSPNGHAAAEDGHHEERTCTNPSAPHTRKRQRNRRRRRHGGHF